MLKTWSLSLSQTQERFALNKVFACILNLEACVCEFQNKTNCWPCAKCKTTFGENLVKHAYRLLPEQNLWCLSVVVRGGFHLLKLVSCRCLYLPSRFLAGRCLETIAVCKSFWLTMAGKPFWVNNSFRRGYELEWSCWGEGRPRPLSCLKLLKKLE